MVEELCTRMVNKGHKVTCYNRGGHHVSGKEFDSAKIKNYKGINLKTVPTINCKGLAAMYVCMYVRNGLTKFWLLFQKFFRIRQS